MKKNIKILIISAVCIAVLSVGLVFVLNLPENEETNKTSDGEAILIFDKTNLDAEEITVSNESGQYDLLGYNYSSQVSSGETSNSIYMIYTMQEYETQQLSKTMTDSLVEQCLYMAALKIVDKSGERDKEYGLDKPRSSISIIYSDNSQIKMYIGNDAPDNKGVYLKVGGSKNVYLVQENMINMFLLNKLQLFTKQLSAKFDSDQTIQTVSLKGTFYDTDVHIKPIDNNANFCNFIMDTPYREICDNEFFEHFGESLYGMSGTTVMSVNVNDDDIKKYGLDKPYMDIEVTASDDTSVHVMVSKADPDQNFYIMNFGGSIIYQMSTEDVEWYGTGYRDFLADSVIMPNMENLIDVDISVDGKAYHYDVTHEKTINEVYEEVIINEVLFNGNSIPYNNMSIFVENVAGIERKEEYPESIDGCKEIFSIKYTFDGDTALTDTMKLYKTSDGQAVIVLNGNIEGYTDLEYVRKVISQVPEIADEKIIEAFNSDEQL